MLILIEFMFNFLISGDIYVFRVLLSMYQLKRLWISKLDVKFDVDDLNSKHYSHKPRLITMSLKYEFKNL